MVHRRLFALLLPVAAACSEPASAPAPAKRAATGIDGDSRGEKTTAEVDAVVTSSRVVAPDDDPDAERSGGPSSDAVAAAASPFEGSWSSACKVATALPDASKTAPANSVIVWQIKGTTLKLTSNVFYTTSCPDGPSGAPKGEIFFALSTEYKLTITGDSKTAPGAQDIQMDSTGFAQLVFLDEAGAAKANRDSFCGLTTHQAGVPLKLDFAKTPLCSGRLQEFSIWQRVGDTIVPGKLTASRDGGSAERRPTELDPGQALHRAK